MIPCAETVATAGFDEAHDAAAPEVGGDAAAANPGEWPPAESPHAPTLPGLDRVRHLFTRKRE